MAEVAAAAAVVGTVVSIAGARAQAKAQAKAAMYNAAVAKRNAETAEIKAEFRKTMAGVEEVTFRERFGKLQRSVDVMYAKAGVTGSGTPRLVMLENARQADEQIAIQNMQAAGEATAYRESGINARLQGDLQRIYAKNYISAGRYKQAGAFVRGVGGVAGAFNYSGGGGGGGGGSLMSPGFTGSTQGGP